MKLSLLFTSFIALSVALPSPEATPEAEAAAVADSNHHHSGYQTDKCGNRHGSTYGYIRVEFGDQYNRVSEVDVPVYCGSGKGMALDYSNVRWARMAGGRAQGSPVCQVKYYPDGYNRAQTRHISSEAAYLSRQSVRMHSIYCNI